MSHPIYFFELFCHWREYQKSVVGTTSNLGLIIMQITILTQVQLISCETTYILIRFQEVSHPKLRRDYF